MPALRLRVDAPPATPARFGLLDTIAPKPLPVHGDLAGVEYDADFCGAARPWAAPCVDPGTGVSKDADDGIDQASGDPITVYHLHSCRLVGSGDREGRARRSLDLGASRAVEEGFGDTLGAAAVDITPAGTAVSVTKGIALAEQYAGKMYGGVPVLHMDRVTATIAISADLIREVDGELRTILGSLVVAGPGYAESTGPSAPAAGAHWMYVTGAVNVWEGKTFLSPVEPAQPYTNEFYTLAERVYVPTYECFVGAIETTLEA